MSGIIYRASVTGIAILSLLVAGCDKTTVEMIADFTDDFNVPAYMWTFNDDECAKAQMETVYKELNDQMSSDARHQAIDRFRQAYKGIFVRRTLNYGPITGAQHILHLLNRRGGEVLRSKALVDTRTRPWGEGTHKTLIDKGSPPTEPVMIPRHLTITPTSVSDESRVRVYGTTDPDAFYAASATTDPDAEVAAKRYYEISNDPTVPEGSKLKCGQFARVQDLY